LLGKRVILNKGGNFPFQNLEVEVWKGIHHMGQEFKPLWIYPNYCPGKWSIRVKFPPAFIFPPSIECKPIEKARFSTFSMREFCEGIEYSTLAHMKGSCESIKVEGWYCEYDHEPVTITLVEEDV